MVAETERPWLDGSNVDHAKEVLEKIKRNKVPILKLDGTQNSFASNYVRICPQHRNMDSWFHMMPVHFNVGPNRRVVACRKDLLDEYCPVCEEAFRLYNSGHEKEGKDLMSSWRSYMNVVKLNKDGTLAEDKVYILSVGPGLFELIEEEFTENGDLSHVETGFNLNIKRKGKSKEDTTYSVKSSGPAPFPDTDVLMGIYDCVELVPVYDEEQLSAMVEGRSPGGANQLSAGEAAGRPALPPAEEGGEAEPSEEPLSAIEPAEVRPGGFSDEDEDEAGGEPASEPPPEEPDPEPIPQTEEESPPAAAEENERMARLKRRVGKGKGKGTKAAS